MQGTSQSRETRRGPESFRQNPNTQSSQQTESTGRQPEETAQHEAILTAERITEFLRERLGIERQQAADVGGPGSSPNHAAEPSPNPPPPPPSPSPPTDNNTADVCIKFFSTKEFL